MNIQHVLSRVNAGDYEFFQNMTDDEVKELSPYVLTLWLRGARTNRREHTIMTEIFVNRKLFQLQKHPRLLYMLACHANSGMGDSRYSFEKDVKLKSKPIKLIMRELECSHDAALMYEGLFTDDDIKELEKKYEEVDK